MDCNHDEFEAKVQVIKFFADSGMAIVVVTCKGCGNQVLFNGLPEGMALDKGTRSTDGRFAYLPFQMGQDAVKVVEVQKEPIGA